MYKNSPMENFEIVPSASIAQMITKFFCGFFAFMKNLNIE